MPNFNQSGPEGRGMATGKGFGGCRRIPQDGMSQEQNENRSVGWGQAADRGNRCGAGPGKGMGRGVANGGRGMGGRRGGRRGRSE